MCQRGTLRSWLERRRRKMVGFEGLWFFVEWEKSKRKFKKE